MATNPNWQAGGSEMITQEQLRIQRLAFAEYEYELIGEIRRTANYFAPDRWTLFDAFSGDQSFLWDDRWRDGELWSRFKMRNIPKHFEIYSIDWARLNGDSTSIAQGL